jgi:hypothetical protein
MAKTKPSKTPGTKPLPEHTGGPLPYHKAVEALEEIAACHYAGLTKPEALIKIAEGVLGHSIPEPENIWPTLPELTEEEKVILSGDWDLVPGAELFKANPPPIPPNMMEVAGPEVSFELTPNYGGGGPWSSLPDHSPMSPVMKAVTDYITNNGCVWQMDYYEHALAIGKKGHKGKSIKVSLDLPKDKFVSTVMSAVEQLVKGEPKPKWFDYPASHTHAGIKAFQIKHKIAANWQIPKTGTKGYAGEKPEFLDPWEQVEPKCCCSYLDIEPPNPFCPLHGVKVPKGEEWKSPVGLMSDLIESMEEVAKKKAEAHPQSIFKDALIGWPEWYQHERMPWYTVLREHSDKMYVEFYTWHKPGSVEYLWELAVVSAYECGVGKHGETKLVGLMRKHIKTVFPSVTYVQLIAAFKRTKFMVGNVHADIEKWAVKGRVIVHAEFPEHVRDALKCALDPKSNLQEDEWVEID